MSDPRARPAGVRERARAEMVRQIMATARSHLASEGAAALSLRAIARDLGMVSSAVYRYVPSRDELLTRLIVEAYDALGAAVEHAEGAVARDDLRGRFRAAACAVRQWAMNNEHEYALIFGSPVPGYQAPESTIPPATRVPAVLVGILADAVAGGRVLAAASAPEEVATALEPAVAAFGERGETIPVGLVARGLMAWTYLFGAVSFDLFGHRHNVVADERAVDHPFFRYEVDRIVEMVGLASSDPAALPSVASDESQEAALHASDAARGSAVTSDASGVVGRDPSDASEDAPGGAERGRAWQRGAGPPLSRPARRGGPTRG